MMCFVRDDSILSSLRTHFCPKRQFYIRHPQFTIFHRRKRLYKVDQHNINVFHFLKIITAILPLKIINPRRSQTQTKQLIP